MPILRCNGPPRLFSIALHLRSIGTALLAFETDRCTAAPKERISQQATETHVQKIDPDVRVLVPARTGPSSSFPHAIRLFDWAHSLALCFSRYAWMVRPTPVPTHTHTRGVATAVVRDSPALR